MTSLPLTILHEQPADAPAIERLQERAFGPGRYARSAYRLREGVAFDPALSFTSHVGTFLVGSNRMTPITIGGVSAQLLGPLVVDPAFMNRGIGRTLIEASLEAAAAAGHRLVMLVGDEPYYSRMGFLRIPDGRVVMPGPVDPARVLWRELAAGAAEGVSGRAWKAF